MQLMLQTVEKSGFQYKGLLTRLDCIEYYVCVMSMTYPPQNFEEKNFR